MMPQQTKKAKAKTAATPAVTPPDATPTKDVKDMRNRSLISTTHGLIFVNGRGLTLEEIPGESGCWRIRDNKGRTVVSLIDWDGNLPLSLQSEILE